MDHPWLARLIPAFGLLALTGLAWLGSSNRRQFPVRAVGIGLLLQLLFGLFILRTDLGRYVFSALDRGVMTLLGFSDEGARFVFGAYADKEFSIALKVLPPIVFFSALMAVLYYLRLMQPVVRGMALIMNRTMGCTGRETLCAAANVFVGHTEAPLVVRPLLSIMSRSELFSMMVGGFATVAGGTMAAYVSMLGGRIPGLAGHLVAASVMSAPAALLIAKVMEPEHETLVGSDEVPQGANTDAENVLDAATQGARDGLYLALNVGAMLIAFVALVAMMDAITTRITSLSLSQMASYLFWPLSFLLGVNFADAPQVALLLGQKIVLNEFIAFAALKDLIDQGQLQSARSATIASYALCGFANFGSVAIQIGGTSSLVPERRAVLAQLALKAMLGGTLAALMTGCVAGILLP